jgi:hypothetical protein
MVQTNDRIAPDLEEPAHLFASPTTARRVVDIYVVGVRGVAPATWADLTNRHREEVVTNAKRPEYATWDAPVADLDLGEGD